MMMMMMKMISGLMMHQHRRVIWSNKVYYQIKQAKSENLCPLPFKNPPKNNQVNTYIYTIWQYLRENKNKQENIDAKHQYAGKLICHALLSSL